MKWQNPILAPTHAFARYIAIYLVFTTYKVMATNTCSDNDNQTKSYEFQTSCTRQDMGC